MILPLAAEREIRRARSRHREKAAAAFTRKYPRNGVHGRGDCHSDEGNGKRESGWAGWPSRGTAETRTSSRPDHSTGAPSAYHPHLARGESPTAVLRRGHYRTPQKGRQDGVRKLSRQSRSCHTFLSLKWLPGDSALTVRRRDCCRRSSAGFDRIARPRTLCLWFTGCRKLGGR